MVERAEAVALMLSRRSTMRADQLGVMFDITYTLEMVRNILKAGKDAPLWTFTRLLFKLSEGDAIAIKSYLEWYDGRRYG